METNLGSFVNIACCNQMGGKGKIIEVVQSLEALIEEAYEEGHNDFHKEVKQGFQESTVKRHLDELNKEVDL